MNKQRRETSCQVIWDQPGKLTGKVHNPTTLSTGSHKRGAMMRNPSSYKLLLALFVSLLMVSAVFLLQPPDPIYSQGGSIEIGKSGPITAAAGDPISYTLTITNTGEDLVTNLVITDTIPAGATYLDGGKLVGDEVHWTLPAMAGGASEQVSFAVTASSAITNTAYGVMAVGGAGVTDIDTLIAGDGETYDYFGYSVAVDGDTAIIGAYGDDDTGYGSGSAYIFERNETGWQQVTKLTASDGADSDHFGISVAISGDTAVIGAYGDDDTGYDSGSAYIFERNETGWQQVTKLTANDAAAGDSFGISVAISGNTALIGAYGNDDSGYSSGSAYIFERTETGWQQAAKLTANDAAAYDFFGYSVAVSGDTAIIGAYGDDNPGYDSGSAYIFEWNSVA